MPKAYVIVVEQGYVIQDEDQKGRALYVGRDGYWTRVRQAASPFRTKSEAEATATDMNKKSGGFE